MPLRPTAFFYLGLFPLVILLWAWADSFQSHTVYTHVYPDTGGMEVLVDRTIGLGTGYLYFGSYRIRYASDSSAIHHRSGHPFGSMQGFHRVGAHAPTPHGWFPPYRKLAWHHPYDQHEFRDQRILIPIWLILGGYLPAWLALSYLHARRKRNRLISALPAPPPQAHPTSEN